MEVNAIEQYVINKLEALEKENAELKKKLEEKKTTQVIGVRYMIDTHSLYITKQNVSQYEKALEEKDFDWLDDNGYTIEVLTWNYEIVLRGRKYRFNFVKRYKKLVPHFVDIDRDDVFETEEAAKETLINQLAKDIEERRKKK